jgi:hypothetical protein
LSFSVADFHTKYDPEAPYEFAATTEAGESLNWRGTLSLLPLRSSGEFELSQLNVPKYAAYYAEHLPFEIEQGVVRVAGRYELVWNETEQVVRLPAGELSATGIVLAAAEGGPGRQSLQHVQLEGISADFMAGQVQVAKLQISEGEVDLHRTAAGVAWMGVLLASEEMEEATAAEQAGALNDMRIDLVAMNQVAYRWHDETLPVSTTIGLNVDQLELTHVSLTDLAQPMGVNLAARLVSGGELAARGTLTAEPLAPALEVELREVDLTPASGYLLEATDHSLVSGRLSATGRWMQGEGGQRWQGDGLSVSDLVLHDATGRKVAGWQQLQLTGSGVQFDPLVAEIGTVELTGPQVLLHRDKAGVINGRVPEVEPVELEAAAEPAASSSQVEVGHIRVAAGRVVWHDETPPLPVTLSVDELSGDMRGWSSQDVAKAQVELTGKVNGVAPWAMTGDLNPLGQPAHADLTITMDRADLLVTDGYLRQYAGFDLEEGSLSLDIDFHLRERAIESETVTVLDQFTLGEKVDSPDATKLPVKLAVALLKDPEGEIVIDVPVEGHLDDPKFRWGRVFWRVIGNLLTKAATSPFALLGAAVGGGGGVDLEHHAFAAGDTAILPAAQQSLAAVLTALEQRPQLKIGIRGEYDPESDAPALRPLVLEARLREQAGPAAFTSEGEWQPLLREANLVALYEQVFGEPPLDPAGVVPPSDAPEPVKDPGKDEMVDAGGPEVGPAQGNTWLVWLRRVFGGQKPPVEPVEEELSEPGPGSFPVPEGVEPELPALPIAEIADRLLPVMEVPEEMLRELAGQRAQATHQHLLEAGLPSERMLVVESSVGAAQVTLDLR